MNKTATDNLGWIKLHRKFLDWEWFSDGEMTKVFLYLLLSANYENKSWKGIAVKRGQLIIGRKALAKRLGITERQIRTCLTKLKTTNEVTIKTTNKFSILTIVNYNLYQAKDEEATSETTSNQSNERPANDQQTTTTKEIKKLRNKEKKISILLWEEKNNELSLSMMEDWIKKYNLDKNKLENELQVFRSKCSAKGYTYENFISAFQVWIRNEKYGNGIDKFKKSTREVL